MQSLSISTLKGWFPRGLVGQGVEVPSSAVTKEGLCPLLIGWEEGKINRIEVINCESEPLRKFVLPRLVEPHTHLDKAFTWRSYPNLIGDYENALALNLEEQKQRSISNVRSRAEKALKMALSNGLRAVRSHIDSFGLSGERSWDVLNEIKKEWSPLIEMQLVALAPLEFWITANGKSMAKKVSKSGGLLGGVVKPPLNKMSVRSNLTEILRLSSELGCGIDLHIDESQIEPAIGLVQLLKVLDKTKISVPITCSHLSSMGLLADTRLAFLADRVAAHEINVIALPLTNSWLLGRALLKTPAVRPLAPIRQLQQAGVVVAVGRDNIQDPWSPLGDFDPLALMSTSLLIAQLEPWKRLGLAPFTTSAASLMSLSWDGTIKPGCPADLIILEGDSWAEVLSSSTKREVLVNGKRLNKTFNG